MGRKNRKQHAAFLAEVEGKPALHAEIIDWCLTLPLWLELPDLLVVHALLACAVHGMAGASAA